MSRSWLSSISSMSKIWLGFVVVCFICFFIIIYSQKLKSKKQDHILNKFFFFYCVQLARMAVSYCQGSGPAVAVLWGQKQNKNYLVPKRHNSFSLLKTGHIMDGELCFFFFSQPLVVRPPIGSPAKTNSVVCYLIY